MMLTFPAIAADLKLVSTGGVIAPVKELIPMYEAASGNKIDASFANPGVTLEHLRKGQPADVLIFNNSIADDILKEGRIDLASRVTVSKSVTGVGVLGSSPKQDIGDKAAFIAFLRAAHTIALADPKGGSTASPPVLAAFNKLGLMPELQPKLRFYPGAAEMSEAIIQGEVEVMIALTSEIIPVKGLQVVGPIPADVLPRTGVQSAAVTSGTMQREAAQNFVDFLHSPAAKNVFTSFGMNPD
jgi:molybdate transport system substrate-binding protein